VFNSIGENIADLVDVSQAAGSYEINWDAGNFASGIYFYQLKAGNFIQTKKMLLIK
jgi:hypothetical protein